MKNRAFRVKVFRFIHCKITKKNIQNIPHTFYSMLFNHIFERHNKSVGIKIYKYLDNLNGKFNTTQHDSQTEFFKCI